MASFPFSFANLANLKELERLYQNYLGDKESVDPSWRLFFEGMAFSETLTGTPSGRGYSDDLRIHLLINAYRTFGHKMAKCNPIATTQPVEPPEIKEARERFTAEEHSKSFPTCGFLAQTHAPLSTLMKALHETYCGSIGAEYKEISNSLLETFIEKEFEHNFKSYFTKEKELEVLNQLTKAEAFESFLHTKYVGQKRFSLEGGETLIPLLSTLIEQSVKSGTEAVILGMAHRGRLNVLANILSKSYAEIFCEFEGHYVPGDLEGTGDVKYHKGFVGKLGGVEVTLVPNPSHLEAVDPVAIGMARAKQNLAHNKSTLPILIHGDASIAGQGVVYETLQLCRLNGYETGGTVHIVVNNQIGFTTLPKDSRSTLYCTEIARAFSAPVFHVNAEDPMGCVKVALLAAKIRHEFQCDVFIDLNCYRKYGHNESDEPFFTQPLEYSLIQRKKPIRELFSDELVAQNVLSREEEKAGKEKFKQILQSALEEKFTKEAKKSTAHAYLPLSSEMTALSKETILSLVEKVNVVPSEMKIHPKVQKLLQARKEMFSHPEEEKTIDWAAAEILSYASLVSQGIHIRLSGEDVRRGTFSHRHAVLVDQITGMRYCPLSHLSQTQAPFEIYNSPLSEFAVLGFDFGYSLTFPNSLVIWEAQFGDFANGAQIIIDQFIASSEQKWEMQSNLTLLLPHGYEGQGPEHSSARPERFLQLTGHNNMRVVNVTTPCQLFHLVRAQGMCADKRPLIIFSPKAVLRHPLCISSLKELMTAHFEEVLTEEMPNLAATAILFCSGKIFYDLLEEKKKRKRDDVALIRIEQLYPFPEEKLSCVLRSFPKVNYFSFVQEEHSNMGTWEYVRPLLEKQTNQKIRYVGRDRSASPAAGSYALHQKQSQALMEQAFYEYRD